MRWLVPTPLRALALLGAGVGLAWLAYVFLPRLAPLLSRPLDWTPVPIAGVEMECFQETRPEPWSYCLSQVPSSKSQELVYHFHGRRGAATWWNDRDYYSGRVHQEWLRNGVEPPPVASISFGPLWLLTEHGEATEGRRMQTFIEHVLPTVERRLGHRVAHRIAVGTSMGGVNALLVATKAPALFDRVAALCAPVYAVSPYAGLGEIWQLAQRSGMSTGRLLLALSLGRHLYPSEESWQLDDPMQRVLRKQIGKLPPLYISCGATDDWGCMQGALTFIEAARALGAEVEWHPRPGGHCDVDERSLARFLAGTR
jgi:hypothetical protein